MRKLEGGVFRWLRTKKLKSRTSGAAEAAEGGRSPRIKTKKSKARLYSRRVEGLALKLLRSKKPALTTRS